MTPYKGYTGRVSFDDEAMVFQGRVVGITHVLTFEGRTVEEVLQAFRDSVDDYLAWAEEDGFEPEIPFTGDIAVRASPDQHRMIFEAAEASRQPIDEWARDVLCAAAEATLRRRAG